MSTLSLLFNEVLYRPILNSLVILQNIIPGHDFGLAIIILTVLIRILLWPLASQSIRSQKALQEIQPELNTLKEKYKNNRAEQARAMMELYKVKKINPASGCLPILIQLPVLIALYWAFLNGLKSPIGHLLYPFVSFSNHINPMFLGLIDLSQKSAGLAVLAGALQYWQTKMLMVKKGAAEPPSGKKTKEPTENFSSMMNKQMLYMMPVLTVFIAYSLPSALALYWAASTAFTIVQQYFVANPPAGGQDEPNPLSRIIS